MSFIKYDNVPLEFNAMSFPWLKNSNLYTASKLITTGRTLSASAEHKETLNSNF